ncbi:hypothetical protein [Metasolibacillus meyeri]|uniref:hypothetical protein n=1 Tax=Metasolibacillus meyeri TaxID=1071052 RepID=UPI000D3158F7|nr:hypothetical protein [Metasolibacillus meyeri]
MDKLLTWFPFILLILLNLLIIKSAKSSAEKWISSGLLMMLLGAPVLFIVSFFIIGHLFHDAFASGVAAIIYSSTLFVNGCILLIKGFFTKGGEKFQ